MKWLLAAVVVLSAGTARAQVKREFEVDLGPLTMNQIVVPAENGEWHVFKSTKDSCKLTAASNQLVITSALCPAVFTTKPNAFGTDEGITIHGTPKSKATVITLKLKAVPQFLTDDKIKLTWDPPPDPKLKALPEIWYYQDGWHKLTADALYADKELQKHELEIWMVDNATWKRAKIDVAPKKDPPPISDKLANKDTPETDCDKTRRKYASANVLCFLYKDGWVHLPDEAERGVIMRANTRLITIAYATKGSQIDQALSGEIGFTDPKVRNETGAADGGAHADLVNPEVPLEPFLREWGPPKPGVHTLTLTMKAKAPATDDATKIDITVDEVYAGAIRLGVGAVFGGARDRTFTAQALPGSGQAEITTSDGGRMDAELVLGASVFFDKGGRSYNIGEPGHWAPYFGIGLLNQSQSGFELLKSIHLGLEYEISRQFSIAFTLVGRKVTRLADGLDVGDPISTMTVPTRTGYEVGVGVVVNLSPEFLKVAKSPAGGFFK